MKQQRNEMNFSRWTGSIATVVFALGWLWCAIAGAAEYRLVGNMVEWGDPSAWSPSGVPGEDATVLVDQGVPLFLDRDVVIATYRSVGAQSEQIIGRGGNRELTITDTLLADKPRGAARFRGHITSDGSSTLALRAGTVDARNAGRLSLGEYHASQTDRALRGVLVKEMKLSGGASVDLFVAQGVVAQLGRVRFGPGGGALYINAGEGTIREVLVHGLIGGSDAVLANSEQRANHDYARSSTTLILDLPAGAEEAFSGRITGRAGGDTADHRIHLVKRGAGTQILSGDYDAGGWISVEQGTLWLNGSFESTETLTVREGGILGGTGHWSGSLSFMPGARLRFQTEGPLRTSMRVWFDPDFGVDRLVGLDAEVPPGRYPLIAAEFLRTGPYGIRNEGSENAHDLGNGRRAWFEPPGLTLVVQ